MEERIIDDEYGRGIRLKKTKDGYVDVTDELAEKETDGAVEESLEETTDEISFEFPTLERDEEDEDLIGLDPEEAEKKRREKEEKIKARRAEYERVCAEGDEALATGSFKTAELKYEKALKLDDEPTAASVGYWKAKTVHFTQPDVLADEYADEGVESLEYDLGYEAVDVLKKEYHEVFKRRLSELVEEETPLAANVEEKQETRRQYLKERWLRCLLAFAIATVPMIVCIWLTVSFGLKNFSTPDTRYIAPTIGFGAGALVCFIVFAVFTNKLINASRMRRTNEKLESTEDGERLVLIRNYKEIYEYFLEDSEETSDEETDMQTNEE